MILLNQKGSCWSSWRQKWAVLSLCTASLLGTAAGWGIGFGPGITGYYVGLSAEMTRHKVTPTLNHGKLKIFDGDHLHEEFKEDLFGSTFMAGHMYALGTFALAGQVYFGVGGKQVSLRDSWKIQRNGISLTARSEMDLWGRWHFGWELLAGVKLSSVLIYGLFGFQGRMMQTRGYLTLLPSQPALVENLDKKAILFFGKDAATIEGVEFAKLQPSHQVVFSPSIGVGIRLYVMDSFFVGLEGRCARRQRTMKARYALYDTLEEGGVFGTWSTSTQEKKDRLEPKFKINQWKASLIMGFRM